MSLSAVIRLSTAVLAAGAQEPSSATVVLTGISLVFLILLILIAVILIQGKIFTSLDKKKQEKEKGEQAAAPVASVAAAAPATVPAPVIEAGIPPEVVAAIIAAVSASTDGAFTLRAVTTTGRGRGSWGLAGVIQATEPF